MIGNRREALDRIAALADEHGLSASEIVEWIERPREADRTGSERVFRTILAYLGVIFVLAGVVTAVNLFWAEMGSAARVVASFGPGFVALLLAIATLKDARYRAASTPLFLIAALLQPTGLFVLMEEYFAGDDPALAGMTVFGAMALQSMLLFASLKRTNLLFFTVLFGFAFFTSVLAWLDVDGDFVALVLGISGLLVSWRIDTTQHRAFTPLTYFAFALCIGYGAFELVESEFPLDFALIGIAAALIYAGVLARSRSLLVAGVLTMLGYLGYYTNEYFADMLGWPVALIVMGLLMLGLSSYAMKLRRGMQTDGT